jgi:hypothetical protein
MPLTAVAFTKERLLKLMHWDGGRSPGHVIGQGKYGKVYLCGSSLEAVLKETWTKGEKVSSCKQAFREHVIAILQTLLVLDAQTPHLPLHYGACINARDGQMQGHMYMEKFDGSLQELGHACLVHPADWAALAFQLMYSLVVLSELFHLVHNDLYPRNVLISCGVEVPAVRYRVDGRLYCVPWRHFAALTDFGIASSGELLGRRSVPEVAEQLGSSLPEKHFGDEAPTKHILRYVGLPAFSRDAYTLFKWIRFATKSLPAPPCKIRHWAAAALRLMDETREELAAPSGLRAIFHTIFGQEWMARHDLPSFAVADDGSGSCETDFALRASGAEKASLLARAEVALAGLPLVS